MRILVVSHEWETASPGGAQRSAAALAHGLARLPEVDSILVSAVRQLPQSYDEPTQVRDGLTELLVESTTDLEHFSWAHATYATNWERVLRETRPDVVHLHHYYHVGVELPLLIRRVLPESAVVMTLHEYLAICLQSGQMMDSLRHLCERSSPVDCANCVTWPVARTHARTHYIQNGLLFVDRFVTPSEFCRQRYLNWGLDPDRISCLPNVLDIARRTSSVRESRSGTGLRLAYIGQHTPYKGIDVLMEAIHLLSTREPRALARVDVYGGGSDRFGEEFHSHIVDLQQREPDLARFRGGYGQDQLVEILDEADAIVVPSIWWENSPVVIEEALARHVPVICSDIGGMAEKVRDGIDGWHFQAGNAASLAEVLSKVSKLDSLDLPDMRMPMAADEAVRHHLALYAEAVAERRDARVSR